MNYQNLPGLIELQILVRRSLAFAASSLAVVVVVGSLDDTPMDVHADEFATNRSVDAAADVYHRSVPEADIHEGRDSL